MIQGAIFDMDGLMFDTEVIWYESWGPALAKYGYTLPDGLAADCRGSAVERTVRVLRRYLGDDAPAEDIIAELRRVAHAAIAADLRKKPGLDELLEWLGDHDIPCAVASSSAVELIQNNLAQSGIANRFAAVVSGEQVEHSKPEPDVFWQAARQIGVDPSRSLVLEDSFAGVRAGHAGGFITVMVPDMSAPNDEILSLTDACCESLLEVRDRLEAGTLG